MTAVGADAVRPPLRGPPQFCSPALGATGGIPQISCTLKVLFICSFERRERESERARERESEQGREEQRERDKRRPC